MEQTEFVSRMEEAVKRTLRYEGMNENVEITKCGYLIYPNQSLDIQNPKDDQEVYPEETLPRGQYLGPLDFANTLTFLWRKGKVPEWINVAIRRTNANEAQLQFHLLCCGRFSGHNEPNLGDIQPFVAIGYFELEYEANL